MNRKIMIVDVAEDGVEVDDVEDHEIKEEEDDDVETDGVEKEEDDDVEDDHVEAQDGTHTLCEPAQSKCTSTCHKSHFTHIAAQSRGPHFVQACAVEMHINVSQEPFYTEIYSKNAAAQNRGSHFVRACSSVWTHCLGKIGNQATSFRVPYV